MSTRIEDVKLEVERMRQKAKLYCDSQIKGFERRLCDTRSRDNINIIEPSNSIKLKWHVTQLKNCNKNIIFDDHGEVVDKYKDIISEDKEVKGNIRKFIFSL